MEWIGVALMVILSAVDAVLTALILDEGGKEKNPVIRWLIGRFGNVPGLVIPKLLSVAAISYIVYTQPDFKWVGWAAAGAFGYISWKNYNLLTALTKR